MTRATSPPPPPNQPPLLHPTTPLPFKSLTVDSWFGMSFLSLPPSHLLFSWLLISLQTTQAQTHVSGHWHIDTRTYTHHNHCHPSLFPALTPWPMASGLDCHRKRETETCREKEVSVSEGEKRPLSVPGPSLSCVNINVIWKRNRRRRHTGWRGACLRWVEQHAREPDVLLDSQLSCKLTLPETGLPQTLSLGHQVSIW